MRPFVLLAWVVLPEHLHCLWRLPDGDADNANRWPGSRPGIPRLFERLRAALAGRSWEAIYVDDDRPDGTAEEVRSRALEFDDVRVFQRSVGEPAAARNP